MNKEADFCYILNGNLNHQITSIIRKSPLINIDRPHISTESWIHQAVNTKAIK